MAIEIRNSDNMEAFFEEITNCSEGLKESTNFVNSDISEIPPYDFGPEYHRTVRLYTLAIMFTVSLLGNSIVVRQLLPLRRGRFPKSKIMFLNLAAADLFVTFATMLSQLIWEWMDQQWIAGDVLCKLFKFLQTYSLCSSTYMLVAIALDRYNAIVRPFAFSPEPKYYALGAWISAFVPAFPCFLVFHEVQLADALTKCVSIFYTSPEAQFWRQTYVMCVFLLAFIFPFLLLLALYIKIVMEIRERSSVFSANQQTASSLPRAKIKTLRMTSAILLAFIILNIPYVAQECLISFGYADFISKNISALAGVISASNSAFNPYIYLMFQSKKTWVGKCFRNLMNVIRSKQLSSSSHRRDTSFVSATSKISSRIDLNVVKAVPKSQTTKVSSIVNGGNKVEETFV